jgi:hypothetical protein
VPQHEDLELLRALSAPEQHDQLEQTAGNGVHHRHGQEQPPEDDRNADATPISIVRAPAHTASRPSLCTPRPGVDDGPLPEAVANSARRAYGGRVPGEARPALEPIRKTAVPSLVASGDHTPGIERICDALAALVHSQPGTIPLQNAAEDPLDAIPRGGQA